MLDKLIELLKTPAKAGILRRKHNRTFTDADDQEMIVAEFLVANDVVVQKHGRWVFGTANHREWMKCSECLVSQTPTGVFTYCPNCGAKMDRKDDT